MKVLSPLEFLRQQGATDKLLLLVGQLAAIGLPGKQQLGHTCHCQGVADAQQRHDLPGLGAAENQLRIGLGQLFAVAEAYPELRANDNFRHLEARITGLENAVADRREFYNDSVNLNNVRIEQFPDVLIAGLFSFRPFRLLEFTEPEKQDVDLAQLFR